MSTDKQRRPRAEALVVANEIKDALAPFCHRIEIAGSIRRGKPNVGDVEIVFVPKTEQRQADFFSTMQFDLASERIEQLLAAGTIAKRGGWGALNKFATHAATGIGIDFFTEPRIEDWWRSLVIRTGPREVNIRLIQSAARKGLHIHASWHGITNARGDIIPCESERHFFEIAGHPYLEPEDRE